MGRKKERRGEERKEEKKRKEEKRKKKRKQGRKEKRNAFIKGDGTLLSNYSDYIYGQVLFYKLRVTNYGGMDKVFHVRNAHRTRVNLCGFNLVAVSAVYEQWVQK